MRQEEHAQSRTDAERDPWSRKTRFGSRYKTIGGFDVRSRPKHFACRVSSQSPLSPQPLPPQPAQAQSANTAFFVTSRRPRQGR